MNFHLNLFKFLQIYDFIRYVYIKFTEFKPFVFTGISEKIYNICQI